MKQEELDKTLELHNKWLNDEEDGVRADLSEANLNGVDRSLISHIKRGTKWA